MKEITGRIIEKLDDETVIILARMSMQFPINKNPAPQSPDLVEEKNKKIKQTEIINTK